MIKFVGIVEWPIIRYPKEVIVDFTNMNSVVFIREQHSDAGERMLVELKYYVCNLAVHPRFELVWNEVGTSTAIEPFAWHGFHDHERHPYWVAKKWIVIIHGRKGNTCGTAEKTHCCNFAIKDMVHAASGIIRIWTTYSCDTILARAEADFEQDVNSSVRVFRFIDLAWSE